MDQTILHPNPVPLDKGYEVFHRYRYMFEMLKKPDLLLVPSAFVQSVILKYYPFVRPKMKVLPPGIPPIRGNGLLRYPHKAPGGKIRFCYFGNILAIKGLHVLIDAFRDLPRERATLTIYGGRTSWDEIYYGRLKEQASDFLLKFPAPFERDRLSEALKDQDVVVLPSICYETFSFVIREANHLGLPVIASSIGAIPRRSRREKTDCSSRPGIGESPKMHASFYRVGRLIQAMDVKARRVKKIPEHAAELVGIYHTGGGEEPVEIGRSHLANPQGSGFVRLQSRFPTMTRFLMFWVLLTYISWRRG